MHKITKKYLKWNYSAVVVLTAIIMVVFILDNEFDDVKPILCLIWSVIWICIVPMFVGNLAKEKKLEPKRWFTISIFATVLSIIVAVICHIARPDSYEDYRVYKNALHSYAITACVFALVPIVTFLVFWLYRFFNSLDWTHEEPAVEIDEHDVVEQIDSSEIPDVVFFGNLKREIETKLW